MGAVSERAGGQGWPGQQESFISALRKHMQRIGKHIKGHA